MRDVNECIDIYWWLCFDMCWVEGISKILLYLCVVVNKNVFFLYDIGKFIIFYFIVKFFYFMILEINSRLKV